MIARNLNHAVPLLPAFAYPPLDRLLSCVDHMVQRWKVCALSFRIFQFLVWCQGLMSLCFSGHLRESDRRYHQGGFEAGRSPW